MVMLQRCTRLIKGVRYAGSTTSQSGLLIDNISGVTTIGFNRPSKKNCLDIDTIRRLKEALIAFDKSDSKIAIIHGEGGTFCSGFDMNDLLDKGYEAYEIETSDWREGPLCTKPVICALNGYAVSEGFELALACDLRVIEETAHVGFLGRRFGIPVAFNGGDRLASLVGQSRALDLILTGKLISGQVAGDWGLAARLVATGTAIGQAFNLAATVAKYPLNSTIYDRYNVMKNSWQKLDPQKLYGEDKIDILKVKSQNEGMTYLPKFVDEGLGRHGTSKYIIPKQLKSWENEDEIIKNEEKAV